MPLPNLFPILFGNKGLDAYVVSMLHMNGADAATLFTDERGKVWTANGNAQIDTAQSKFGGASGLFDGTGDYIDTPDHADFDVGSGNFTIEAWVRLNATGINQYICGQMDSAATATTRAWSLAVLDTNKLEARVYNSAGTAFVATSAGSLTTGQWYHVAVVRNGNTMTLYINGTADGSVSVAGVTINNNANKPTIGRPGEYVTLAWNGWIDEFRFSLGIARWTANFTPPDKAY